MLQELLHFVMHALSTVFFIGMAGSSIVAILVVISFSDELFDLFGD